MIMEAVSIYPAVVRYGGGYWSEIVGNLSGQMADVLETMIRVARRPDRSQEALTDLLERSRQYFVSSGSTFERILLDFNQALVRLGRLSPESASRPGQPAAAGSSDPIVVAFQQLADVATAEALKLQSGGGQPDMDAIRSRLEACLGDLRRLEGNAAASRRATTA
jgi:hypothetical protein